MIWFLVISLVIVTVVAINALASLDDAKKSNALLKEKIAALKLEKNPPFGVGFHNRYVTCEAWDTTDPRYPRISAKEMEDLPGLVKHACQRVTYTFWF